MSCKISCVTLSFLALSRLSCLSCKKMGSNLNNCYFFKKISLFIKQLITNQIGCFLSFFYYVFSIFTLFLSVFFFIFKFCIKVQSQSFNQFFIVEAPSVRALMCLSIVLVSKISKADIIFNFTLGVFSAEIASFERQNKFFIFFWFLKVYIKIVLFLHLYLLQTLCIIFATNIKHKCLRQR